MREVLDVCGYGIDDFIVSESETVVDVSSCFEDSPREGKGD